MEGFPVPVIWKAFTGTYNHMGCKSVSNKTVATSGVHITSTIFPLHIPHLSNLTEIWVAQWFSKGLSANTLLCPI